MEAKTHGRERPPMFERRHYEAIARVILDARKSPKKGNATETISAIEEELANLFARDNDRFDSGRFFAACDPVIKGDDR